VRNDSGAGTVVALVVASALFAFGGIFGLLIGAVLWR
jgi:hypothetical protein